MIQHVGPIVDTAYLTVWRLRKTTEHSAKWERDAGAAIWMTLPILLLVESSFRATQKWSGVDSLAGLAANRIVYGLLIFFPLWFVVYNILKMVNKKTPAAERLEQMISSSTATYQWTCVVSYFALPVLLFVVMFFV